METESEKKWRIDRNKEIVDERTRLLAINDLDALSLPSSERYQRMRYQREILAAEWLKEQQKSIFSDMLDKRFDKFSSKKRTKWANRDYDD